MSPRSDEESWSALVRTLHWSTAILILVQGAIGLAMVRMGLTPAKVRVFALHKSIGILVLALVLLRIAWRLGEQRSVAIPPASRWQACAAHAMHLALYTLILAVPLSGWWFNSTANAPLAWFGLFYLPGLTHGYDPVWKPRALWLHQASCWLLAGLLVGHVGAALWHHFGRRDDVLRRMLWKR